MAYKQEVAPYFEGFEQKLEKAITHLKNELGMIRAGRANPQVLNRIFVDYYGTPTPISQMANISVPEARVLLISLWDNSAIKEVSKAIMASDLGINPVDDGKNIRLIFPQLNEERRKELVKQLKKICEDSKIALRGERRDILEDIKRLKKDGALSEDEEKQYSGEVQKILDKKIEIVDKLAKEKEAEVLEV